MSRVRPSDRLSAWLRSFSVHGTWNHRTLLGGGLAYALLPVLRRVHAGDPMAMRAAMVRHLGTFNAHPYLVSAAVGALARLEAEGREEEVLDRFRSALGGPLGSLGDRVVWGAWRPFCALVAGAVYLLGVPAGWVAAGFFLLYNVGHVGLRAWGFRAGWRTGIQLGGLLRSAPLERSARILTSLNAVLLGAVSLGLWIVVPVGTTTVIGGALLAAGVVGGYLWPGTGRRLAPLLIVAVPAIGWFLG